MHTNGSILTDIQTNEPFHQCNINVNLSIVCPRHTFPINAIFKRIDKKIKRCLKTLNFVIYFTFLLLIKKVSNSLNVPRLIENKAWKNKKRGHPGSNRGPLDLQSNALPLSYTPRWKTLSNFGFLYVITLMVTTNTSWELRLFVKKKKNDSRLSFTSDNFIDLIGKGDVYI